MEPSFNATRVRWNTFISIKRDPVGDWRRSGCQLIWAHFYLLLCFPVYLLHKRSIWWAVKIEKERKKEKSTVASTCCGFFSCSETNSWHPAATKKEQLRNDPVTIWYQEWRSHIHEKMKSARTFYDYSFVRCKIKKAEHTHTHSLVVSLKIHTKKMSHGFEQTTGKLSVDPGDEEAGKTLPSHYTTLGNVER